MTVGDWPSVCELREHMRVLDIGIAIGKRSAGEFLIGVSSSPEFGAAEIRQVGVGGRDDAQSTLDRLNEAGGAA